MRRPVFFLFTCGLAMCAGCSGDEQDAGTSQATGGTAGSGGTGGTAGSGGTGGSATGGMAGSATGGMAGSATGGTAGSAGMAGSAGAAGSGGAPQIADYYVAPDGDDANPGTVDQPFATWQKFADIANPGELCYVRGGTYALAGDRRDGFRVSRHGTDGLPIRLFAYPGEIPVLDCSGYTYDGSKYCVMHDADWWHYKGLTVTGVKVDNTDGSAFATGILVGGSHNVLEQLDSHHHEGTGIRVVGDARDNLVLNCDSHHNYDPSAQGGNADGFNASFLSTVATGNVLRGCRAWSNSDDGYDLWEANALVVIEGSWAFWNGYLPGTNTEAGNGDGFKCGRNEEGPRHVVRHCAAFENRTRGFDDNGAAGPLEWTNNIAFDNGTRSFKTADQADVLRNNIAMGAQNQLGPNADESFNSWTLPVVVDPSDFESTDTAGTDGSRQPDGSFPRPDFLRLAVGSDLIGAGENGADLGP